MLHHFCVFSVNVWLKGCGFEPFCAFKGDLMLRFDFGLGYLSIDGGGS